MQRTHRHVHDLLAFESLNHLRLAHVRVAAVTQAEVVTFAPATIQNAAIVRVYKYNKA